MPSRRKRQAVKKHLNEERGIRARTRRRSRSDGEARALRADRALRAHRSHDWALTEARIWFSQQSVTTASQKAFQQLCAVLPRIAPRLLGGEYARGIALLAGAGWYRPVSDWRPRRKSRHSQFRSLCEHLLARYPTPALLWSAFTEEASAPLAPTSIKVAGGASLARLVRTGDLTVPLTKRQCHQLLREDDGLGLLGAIRRVQVQAEGGDARLLRAWLATVAGGRVHSRDYEQFWLEVLRLFARASMLDPAQVGPLVDYIEHRKREDHHFHMKGRTVNALARGMEEWHREINQTRGLAFSYPECFEPSGFDGGDFDHSHKDRRSGRTTRMLWRVREILTSQELRQEGRAQRHCVYSYGRAIVQGRTSIWSLTLDQFGTPERCLTLEVSKSRRAIVQVRGFANRLPTNSEHRVLLEWASRNGLTVKV